MAYGTFNRSTNASSRKAPKTQKNLENWAATRGTLHAGSTVNETLFFYKWLFFGEMTKAEILAKLRAAGLMQLDRNLSNSDLEDFFSIEEKSQSMEGILEALKEQDDEARYFPIPERFIAALRNWVLYGKEYLDWNDLLAEYHCSEGPCFFVVADKDNVPPGEEYILLRKLEPYMKPSTQLQIREGIRQHPGYKALRIRTASKAMRGGSVGTRRRRSHSRG